MPVHRRRDDRLAVAVGIILPRDCAAQAYVKVAPVDQEALDRVIVCLCVSSGISEALHVVWEEGLNKGLVRSLLLSRAVIQAASLVQFLKAHSLSERIGKHKGGIANIIVDPVGALIELRQTLAIEVFQIRIRVSGSGCRLQSAMLSIRGGPGRAKTLTHS